MKMFMLCAVDEMIIPSTMNPAPIMATQRRPIKSEREPTKGHIAASARRFARTCSVLVPSEFYDLKTYKPNPTIRASNVTIDVRRYPS